MIASAAKAHVALVNYHFSSKEMLFEAAIERRAARLGEAWRAALNEVSARPSPSVEDILEAWWLPFGARDLLDDTPWSNYLCIVARIATATDGLLHHADARVALAAALRAAGRHLFLYLHEHGTADNAGLRSLFDRVD